VTTPKVGPAQLRVHAGIGRLLNRSPARVTVIGAVPECGPVLLAVNHTALVDGPMLYGLLPRPVAFGEPLGLPAGRAARRTVAAAAGEIHRALAAHVAATRPAPVAEPE
jgi:1-acyl-sn-glycerol-3-phosphate acyltransferase